MTLSADIIADYGASLRRVGETVTIRRYSGSGDTRTPTDVTAWARVAGYEPAELVGAVRQGDRKLIVLAEDLEGGQIALPLRKGDKAIVRGLELNIEAADDNTRRVEGVLVAIELTVRG